METMRLLFVTLLMLASLSATDFKLQSPDGQLELVLTANGNHLSYRAHYAGQPLVTDSRLGLDGWAADWAAPTATRRTMRDSWRPVYGERAEVPNRFNELTLATKRLTVVTRVYDEGFAFRYRLEGSGPFEAPGELTAFHFPASTRAWQEYGTEGEYSVVTVDQIKPQCERPLTVALANGVWAALGEAATADFPRMLLSPDGAGGLRTDLDGNITGQLPFETPWRYLVVGHRPGDLLERNYLVLNLNAPQAITDTAWIRPGKVMREVTLSTSGGKRLVDFAASHGINYIEYDAGWYGNEYKEESDARHVALDPDRVKDIPNHDGLDLKEVIRYAKSKDVGVILYVNRRALERQLDELLPLYKSWGVAGLKFGFVQVRSQHWTAWLHAAIRKAAAYQLMVDVHDNHRPTGYTRTYPNLMTVEGVRGNEHMPTARHNTTLPFTRAVAGPADYTICWSTPRLKNTRAHQMAQSVVSYSPWQFLYWYDRPQDVREEPALDFFRALPTVWDETRVLDGLPGEFAVVARRKGAEWWIGAITNEEARRVTLDAKFVGKQKATVYCDGALPTEVKISKVASGPVELQMAANGGCAVRLTASDPAAAR